MSRNCIASRRPCVRAFFWFLTAVFVSSWSSNAAAQMVVRRVIGKISVEGNTKTGADLIVAASELKPGMLVDTGTLDSARQRILNKRVFVNVRLEPMPSGSMVDLRIIVEERWTLLPIPFVSSSYGVTRGGAFLLDTNLLGRMKTVAAGFSLSNQGTTVAGFFQDPSILGSRWAFRAGALHSTLNQRRHDGPELIYAFHETRYELGAALGYQLNRNLLLYGGTFFLSAAPKATGIYRPPRHVEDLGGVNVELNLRAADYHSYFDEGLVLRAMHRQGFIGRSASQSRLGLQLISRTVGDQSVTALLQYLGSTGDPYVDAFRLGASVGTRGFVPQGLWAEHIGTATLEYQNPTATLRLRNLDVQRILRRGTRPLEVASRQLYDPGTRYALLPAQRGVPRRRARCGLFDSRRSLRHVGFPRACVLRIAVASESATRTRITSFSMAK
ncbi:MAG: POTRA domain-containing protein [Polyangiaceae bacterium]